MVLSPGNAVIDRRYPYPILLQLCDVKRKKTTGVLSFNAFFMNEITFQKVPCYSQKQFHYPQSGYNFMTLYCTAAMESFWHICSVYRTSVNKTVIGNCHETITTSSDSCVFRNVSFNFC